MKLQLDTTNKIIKLENDVLLSELIEMLEKLLPNGLWKEFNLKTNVTINNWSSPIYVDRYIKVPSFPSYPWFYASNSTTPTLSSGTYNVQC